MLQAMKCRPTKFRPLGSNTISLYHIMQGDIQSGITACQLTGSTSCPLDPYPPQDGHR